MSQKDCFPQFVATADPAGLDPVAEEKTGLPAMTLTREIYAAVTGGGGVIAAVQPVGDTILPLTLGLVVTNALHVWNGLEFINLTLSLMDGEPGPLSGSPTVLPTYSLVAGVSPTVELRAAQVHHANGGDIDATVLGDDLGGLLGVAGVPYLFDGDVLLSAQRLASAINLALQSGAGAALVRSGGDWAQQDTPAAATQATTSRAAGAAGTRHVCTSITISLAAVAAQVPLIFNLRDGATGAGTILWSVTLNAPAANGRDVVISGLSIVGSDATAMTLESAAAPAATNFAAVAMTGYSAS